MTPDQNAAAALRSPPPVASRPHSAAIVRQSPSICSGLRREAVKSRAPAAGKSS